MRRRVERLAEFDVATQFAGSVPSALVQVAFGMLCFGGFLLARTAVDQVAPAAGSFALIYPAILIATLYGRWRAGAATYIAAMSWTWYAVLPRVSPWQLANPNDSARTVVNAVTLLVVVIFAEIFRAAIRRAAAQRDAAMREMRELNATLEAQVAERTREQSRTWNVSPDLLGVLSRSGIFETVNPAWQRTLGWPDEQLRTTPFVEFVHPDDLAETRDAWAVLNRGLPVLRLDNRCRRADGGWCWLSWVIVPERDRFYCSARDVTIEKQAEVELAAVQESLRQSQKLEAIGQLTGGVAHDFNNLLTVIRGSVDLLRRPGLTDDKRARYIDAIGSTADRATALTGQLLAFARRQALKPEAFDAGASLLEVAAIVRTLAGSQVMLDTRLAKQACFVRADRSQFDTAIVNMAINARDAMAGEGTLTITVEAVAGIPEVRSHPPVAGDFVAISIADTGRGIAADDRDRIFEPFFTTKGPGQGTGLGLSQVIGFAKQSDGDIRVDSVVGQGTTFTLYLPRVASAAASDEADRPRPEPVEGAGLCVLLVEDNAQVGEFATQALRELGYDSVLAGDGAQALAELAKDSARFQVVFSDVVMPGMSGLELGAEIRRLYPGLPVVLTSGYSHVLAQTGSHGFELLHKPYSVEQLSRALAHAQAWTSRPQVDAADADAG